MIPFPLNAQVKHTEVVKGMLYGFAARAAQAGIG